MSSLQGLVTFRRDTRPPFIQARDLGTFWDCMEKISKNHGSVSLEVESIIIGDKTYKGPVVLSPEDIEKRSIKKLVV